MLKSEKASLLRFLLIYFVSTFTLFSIASWIFYTSQKHYIYDQQRESLRFQAQEITVKLRLLHQSDASALRYPHSSWVDSAIYDVDKNYIFGTYKEIQNLDDIKEKEGDKLYYLTPIEPYYLGAGFLLVSKDLDASPVVRLQRGIMVFLLGAGVFFIFLGIFLGRLFVAPMRDSMTKMNQFIQDTTHELNTPISTILANIEMIEAFGHGEQSKELQRIEIASKTLSRLYDDLTYLNLNHHYYRKIISLNLSEFIEERMVYFWVQAEHKGLEIVLEIAPNIFLDIDKNDATRLVDNLITNAIKYNKPKGFLKILLTSEYLSVIDEGIGIPQKNIETITQRFRRANKSEGGFGIGLDIVNQVVNSYKFTLQIESLIDKGTEVRIQWHR